MTKLMTCIRLSNSVDPSGKEFPENNLDKSFLSILEKSKFKSLLIVHLKLLTQDYELE